MSIEFPSLYADLAAETRDGRSGYAVVCTATRKPLGFVWWSNPEGTVVAWHFETTGGKTGERTTKRNAVQALRDAANLGLRQPRLPLEDVADAPKKPPKRTPRQAPPPAPPTVVVHPEPARRVWVVDSAGVASDQPPAKPSIDWNQFQSRDDITQIVGDALKGVKK